MQQQTFPPIGRQQMNAGFFQTQSPQLVQQQVPAFPSQTQQNTNAQFTQQQINTGSFQTRNPQLVQQQVPAFPSQTQPISKAPFAQQQINTGSFQTTNSQMAQQQVPAFSSQTQQISNTPYAQQIQGGSNQGRYPQQGLQQQPIAAFQQQGAYYGLQQQATPQQGPLYSSQQIQQGRLSYYPTMQQMPMFVQPIATQPVNAFGPNQQTQFYAATPMQQFNYAPNPQPYYYNFQIRQPALSSIKS